MKPKFTLVQPEFNQIKVSGCLSANWSGWIEKMTVTVKRDGDDSSKQAS